MQKWALLFFLNDLRNEESAISSFNWFNLDDQVFLIQLALRGSNSIIDRDLSKSQQDKGFFVACLQHAEPISWEFHSGLPLTTDCQRGPGSAVCHCWLVKGAFTQSTSLPLSFWLILCEISANAGFPGNCIDYGQHCFSWFPLNCNLGRSLIIDDTCCIQLRIE